VTACPHCERATPADSAECARCGYALAWPPSPLPRTYAVGTLAIITTAAVALTAVGRVVWLLLSTYLDDRSATAALGALVLSPLQGLAGVLVIVWLWRTMKNIEAFPGRHDGMKAGWAIGAWFVPIVNIYFPFKVMRQVADEEVDQSWSGPVLVLWWATYLVANFMGYVIGFGSAGRPSATQAGVAAGTFAAAGAALCVLVFAIGRAQQARLDRAQARQLAMASELPGQPA
jgi:hypothetical protein